MAGSLARSRVPRQVQIKSSAALQWIPTADAVDLAKEYGLYRFAKDLVRLLSLPTYQTDMQQFEYKPAHEETITSEAGSPNTVAHDTVPVSSFAS